jgi:glycosyltransferase involved in cell wall biosynthesis
VSDILVVSVDGTIGWRNAADELVGALSRAGAEVRRVSAGPLPRVRTFALTDFVQARAARVACMRVLAEHQPAAVVYCSITSALLWPRPGAIWLDSIAAENRPGRHGVWQRVVERRRLRQTPLVLAMSPRSLAPLRYPHPPTVVVPTPIEAPDSGEGVRDIAALTYAGNPQKRRLEFVLNSWAKARRPGETLLVTGIEGRPTADGVELTGKLPASEFRSLLRRSRVFLAAPTHEDYGIAPLEALAAGCIVATTPAPGPYPARDIARELDPRLVTDELFRAARTALDDPIPGYAQRAAELLVPFTRAAVDRTVAEEVLPRLLASAA